MLAENQRLQADLDSRSGAGAGAGAGAGSVAASGGDIDELRSRIARVEEQINEKMAEIMRVEDENADLRAANERKDNEIDTLLTCKKTLLSDWDNGMIGSRVDDRRVLVRRC